MRATQAPEQWRKLLNALHNDDYDTAREIAVTYRFTSDDIARQSINVRREPRPGDYVAKSPSGKLTCHEISNQLSMYLGFSYAYVQVRVNKYSHQTITRGKMKGWSFWRN